MFLQNRYRNLTDNRLRTTWCRSNRIRHQCKFYQTRSDNLLQTYLHKVRCSCPHIWYHYILRHRLSRIWCHTILRIRSRNFSDSPIRSHQRMSSCTRHRMMRHILSRNHRHKFLRNRQQSYPRTEKRNYLHTLLECNLFHSQSDTLSRSHRRIVVRSYQCNFRCRANRSLFGNR